MQIRTIDGRTFDVTNMVDGQPIHRDNLFDYDMPWRVNKHMMEFNLVSDEGGKVLVNMSHVVSITGL
jgi:hypothetical protein